MPAPPTPFSTAELPPSRALAGKLFWPRLGRFCRYVLPLILWMALIFLMSTRVGSSENTAPLLVNLLQRLWPALLEQLSIAQIDLLNYLFRKLAHVGEYGLLTILAVRAFQQDRVGWRWRSGLGAVILSLLYASSDEWHQKFVANRTGTLIDVGVDAVGVAIALGLCWLWYRGNRSLSEEIARLAALHDRGALTDAEFQWAKEQVLGR
jgi:VanZ family protein